MTTNALRIEDVQLVSFPKPATKPALIRVDLAELNRVTYALLLAEDRELHTNGRQHVSAYVGRKLTVKTLGAFLTSGFSGLVRGLNKCLNIQDHAERLDALHTLEAYYSMFKSRKAGSVEKVTPDMLQREKELIQMFPATHTASPEWIESYEAQVAAKFEGKAARMAKKEAFCEKVFGK